MCSGRVDPQFILESFAKGADGVLIGGCHPGDCHYQEGNYKALRRFYLLKKMVKEMGIEDDRLRLEWISAAEGDRVRTVNDGWKVRAWGSEVRRLRKCGEEAAGMARNQGRVLLVRFLWRLRRSFDLMRVFST
jgi:coenzyme F420-reducing hydrogenase delta subunit